MNCKQNFTWQSRRIVKSMKDLSPSEIEQWKSFLRQENLDLENYDDFFSEENDEMDGFDEEIYVETWLYTPGEEQIVLKDIFAFPGDNQAGAIFIEDDPQLIFLIGDTWLSKVDIKDATLLQKQLQDQMDTFSYVRDPLWNQYERHEDDPDWVHCHAQILKSDEDYRKRRMLH